MLRLNMKHSQGVKDTPKAVINSSCGSHGVDMIVRHFLLSWDSLEPFIKSSAVGRKSPESQFDFTHFGRDGLIGNTPSKKPNFAFKIQNLMIFPEIRFLQKLKFAGEKKTIKISMISTNNYRHGVSENHKRRLLPQWQNKDFVWSCFLTQPAEPKTSVLWSRRLGPVLKFLVNRSKWEMQPCSFQIFSYI